MASTTCTAACVGSATLAANQAPTALMAVSTRAIGYHVAGLKVMSCLSCGRRARRRKTAGHRRRVSHIPDDVIGLHTRLYDTGSQWASETSRVAALYDGRCRPPARR